MAAPSPEYLCIDALRLTCSTLDDHRDFSRWPSSSSSSSLSTSSSTSRSTSCSGFSSCPTMSKSLTDSMSSDTTENETPPESPCEETTPVFRDARKCPIVEYEYSNRRPCRPELELHAFPGHLSLYADASPDAGYETECEEKSPRARVGMTTRRKILNRVTFRRRGEPSAHRSTAGANASKLSAPHIAASTCIGGRTTASRTTPSPNPNSASPQRRSSLTRSILIPNPNRPGKITLPSASSAPVFPNSSSNPGSQQPIGLGLGIGLPSTLSQSQSHSYSQSAVRNAPNCAHRSSTDYVPPSSRFIHVTPADIMLPLDVDPFPPLPPLPVKPRLGPTPSHALPPLDLLSPLTLDNAPIPPLPLLAPQHPHSHRGRHAAFCFSHGDRERHGGFCTTPYGTTAAAFLALANHAQTLHSQTPTASTVHGIRNTQRGAGLGLGLGLGPPSRLGGSQLDATMEDLELEDEGEIEVCAGDRARGIRRFEAVSDNPYFANVGVGLGVKGYCVTSG
ncbi:hypothetical protein K439DRAFT_1641817 [Ramaria rubella]|nr:hypothetical protein K439DRAFT_1641817 [Ramaria rubella]